MHRRHNAKHIMGERTMREAAMPHGLAAVLAVKSLKRFLEMRNVLWIETSICQGGLL